MKFQKYIKKNGIQLVSSCFLKYNNIIILINICNIINIHIK